MPTHRLSWFAALFLASALVTSGAQAQPTRRLDVHPDTLATRTDRLVAGRLCRRERLRQRPGLRGTQCARRSSRRPGRAPVRPDRAHQGPSRDLRRSLIGIIQASENRADLNVRTPLQELVRSDPDSFVLRSAIEALRVMALRQTQLPTLLAGRIARAREANDTALIPLLLEADESFAHMQRPIHAPAFVRTPPPPSPSKRPFGRHIGSSRSATTAPRTFAAAGSHQVALAAVMRAYHEKKPFTFGITTGDNFYPTSFPVTDGRELEDVLGRPVRGPRHPVLHLARQPRLG